MDYFDARYYSSGQGRFTSCDPILVTKTHLANPQRWNLYSYVNNNPLGLVDPDGRDPQGKAGGRIIDIFITVTAGEPGPDFSALKQIKTDPTDKVNLYTVAEGTATAAKAAESLRSKDRTVIIIGHSTANESEIKAAMKGERLKGVGLYFGGKGEITATDDGKTLLLKQQNGEMVDIGAVRASNVIIFTCDTGSTIQAIASNMRGGNLMYTNNGADGETGMDALQNAGYVVAQDVIRGETNMQNIQSNAQINIDIKRDTFCRQTNGYCNRGDEIVSRTIK